jgi:hypothetical protein
MAYSKKTKATRCWNCGHPDSRDRTHARGCPELPALSNAEVFRLMREAYGVGTDTAPIELATDASIREATRTGVEQ